MFETQYSSQECLSTAFVFAKECWVNNLQGSKYRTVRENTHQLQIHLLLQELSLSL